MKITSVDAIDFIVWVNNECIEKIVLAVVKLSVKAPLYDKIELPPLRESERAQSLMYRVLRKSTETFKYYWRRNVTGSVYFTRTD